MVTQNISTLVRTAPLPASGYVCKRRTTVKVFPRAREECGLSGCTCRGRPVFSRLSSAGSSAKVLAYCALSTSRRQMLTSLSGARANSTQTTHPHSSLLPFVSLLPLSAYAFP
jgi:hypothetical protein